MQPETKFVQLEEVRLHLRVWQPAELDSRRAAFLLLHGLSSNARTWDLVAGKLATAGFTVIAVDQRGHGLSSKTSGGYDFASVSSDLVQLISTLDLENIILAGQSWGGNVVLEAVARYPHLAEGLVFVDGGFIQLHQRGSWEQVSRDLLPPDLVGMKRSELTARIGEMHPTWIPDGVEMTLGNFELMSDGTVRPWLALKNHMEILRSLYDQDVTSLFPQIQVPVLICPADDRSQRSHKKRAWVETVESLIPVSRVRWFDGAAHDIHVDRPGDLAAELVSFAEQLK